MIKVGIIGGTGYTAGELIRILINHPKIKIQSIVSHSNYGRYIYDIHKELLGDTNIKFTKELNENIDIVFLCIGHGLSRNIVKNLNSKFKIIDLSEDFRLCKNSSFFGRNFIYGLPEQQKNLIKNSFSISNPGCFATAIEIAILPIAYKKILKGNIHISAITGSTGSGRNLTDKNNFSWRNNNISNYKIFIHQHLKEIYECIFRLQKSFSEKIYFIPYRGNFSRGIIATLYTNSYHSLELYKSIYMDYYSNEPFVHIANNEIDIKQVVGTNKCILHLSKINDKIIITSVIDNLIKGASGQAIQNLNIMYDIQEDCGLKLKPIGI